MTRETILIILGVLVALSPWSGLPLAWLTWFLLPAGIGVAAIAYTMRTRARTSSSEPMPSTQFNT